MIEISHYILGVSLRGLQVIYTESSTKGISGGHAQIMLSLGAPVTCGAHSVGAVFILKKTFA